MVFDKLAVADDWRDALHQAHCPLNKRWTLSVIKLTVDRRKYCQLNC